MPNTVTINFGEARGSRISRGCDLEQWAKENDKWDKMTLVLFGTVYIVSSS
jgi:hypothetical protein